MRKSDKLKIDLLNKIDACKPQDYARLNNQIAELIMGWHLVDGDTERLWRYKDGCAVMLDIGSFRDGHPFAKGVLVCAHPWMEGVNKDNHLSFNPVINHHSSIVDWRDILMQKIDSDNGTDVPMLFFSRSGAPVKFSEVFPREQEPHIAIFAPSGAGMAFPDFTSKLDAEE